MRVLVACEHSGVVRRAFAALGHDAWSCDVLPAEDESPNHIKDDVRKHLEEGWDLMVAHPPCTHIACSGGAWFAEKRADGRQQEGIDFFMEMWNAPIEKVAVENPISIMSTVFQPPSQIINPWMFGHPECKATCLWIRKMPLLRPTAVVPEKDRIRGWSDNMPETKDRWKKRSRTFEGIAAAMAAQWSGPPRGFFW